MLELKKEVKEANLDVAIFVSKSKGRRLVFPIDTPQEEYQKFAELGFRIFRCIKCQSDSCIGSCSEDSGKLADIYGLNGKSTDNIAVQIANDTDNLSGVEFDLQTTYDSIMSEDGTKETDSEFVTEMNALLSGTDNLSGETEIMSEVGTDPAENIFADQDNMINQTEDSTDDGYDDLSLADLRELFPHIKSTSKKGFINQIRDGK